MSWGFAPYVSVAEKREKADKALEKLKKKNKNPEPIRLTGTAIAVTWWGKAWIKNLENYADYANRIGRGRSYVKNHAVLDLKITREQVIGLVQGTASKPYEVTIRIDPLGEKNWKEILSLCNRRIDSVEQLVAGKFPKELEVMFAEPRYGLFPAPEEIHLGCSCPDYAYMCKHVAAILYGVGARLDSNPLLFFELRGVDYQELIKKSIESKLSNMLKNAGKKSGRVIDEADVQDIFGI